MKLIHLVFVIVLAVALQSCGTNMTIPDSRFLSSYVGLSESPDTSSSSVRTSAALDPSRITLGDVEWRAGKCKGVSPEDESKLVSQLRNELQQRITELPLSATGRPAVLRAAITRVETVSPPLNTLETLLFVIPFDRGGAAVEIEAVDPDSGRQVAALRLGYFAPLTDLKARFSKFGPATIALKKAANDFASLLRPEADASLSAR